MYKRYEVVKLESCTIVRDVVTGEQMYWTQAYVNKASYVCEQLNKDYWKDHKRDHGF